MHSLADRIVKSDLVLNILCQFFKNIFKAEKKTGFAKDA